MACPFGFAVIDVDDTLCASPPVIDRDYRAWEQTICASPPPVVEGARTGVATILAAGITPLIVTARSVRLRDATRWWIESAFPGLRGVEISLREDDDLRPGVLSKIERLERFRQRLGAGVSGPPPRALIVDDDPAMRHAARDGDLFALAPGCWWFLRNVT